MPRSIGTPSRLVFRAAISTQPAEAQKDDKDEEERLAPVQTLAVHVLAVQIWLFTFPPPLYGGKQCLTHLVASKSVLYPQAQKEDEDEEDGAPVQTGVERRIDPADGQMCPPARGGSPRVGSSVFS